MIIFLVFNMYSECLAINIKDQITQLNKGDYVNAEAEFLEKIKSTSNKSELAVIYQFLGVTQYLLGDQETSKQSIQKGFEYDPTVDISDEIHSEKAKIFFSNEKKKISNKPEKKQERSPIPPTAITKKQDKSESNAITTTLKVTSMIKEANVYIDNVYMGKVNETLSVSKGNIVLEVKANGYFDFNRKFNILASQNNSVHVTLMKIPVKSNAKNSGPKKTNNTQPQQLSSKPIVTPQIQRPNSPAQIAQNPSKSMDTTSQTKPPEITVTNTKMPLRNDKNPETLEFKHKTMTTHKKVEKPISKNNLNVKKEKHEIIQTKNQVNLQKKQVDYLNFLPFGVGQFKNKSYPLGAAFASLQAFSLYYYYNNNSKAKQLLQDGDNFLNQRLVQENQLSGAEKEAYAKETNEFYEKFDSQYQDSRSQAYNGLIYFTLIWATSSIESIFNASYIEKKPPISETPKTSSSIRLSHRFTPDLKGQMIYFQIAF